MARDSGGLGEARDDPPMVTESTDTHSGETRADDGTKLTPYGKVHELVAHEGVRRNQVNSEIRHTKDWAEHESQDWPGPQQDTEPERTEQTDQRAERPPDPEGSWRDPKSDRYLTPEQNTEVTTRYEALAERADRYGAQVQEIAERAGGDTPGYEFRLKGEDRLKDKIAARLSGDPDVSVDTVLPEIADAVRYTIRVPDDNYAQGVDRAVTDLRGRGLQLVEDGWRNSWDNDVYRGINSRWRDPMNGQLLEVQFHTPGSLYAKEATHEAYERARLPGLVDEELQNLDHIQSNVTKTAPPPDGATDLRYEPDWRPTR